MDLTGVDGRNTAKVCNEWLAGDMVGSGKVSWSTLALQESETGTYGDPSCATAETGRLLLQGIVDEYCSFLRCFWEHDLPPRRP